MRPTLKRLAALAALGTLGIAGPVAGANAATAADLYPLPIPHLQAGGLPTAGAGLAASAATTPTPAAIGLPLALSFVPHVPMQAVSVPANAWTLPAISRPPAG